MLLTDRNGNKIEITSEMLKTKALTEFGDFHAIDIEAYNYGTRCKAYTNLKNPFYLLGVEVYYNPRMDK